MTGARFSEIECLRGLAIMLVVAHHANGFLYGNKAWALVMLPWPMAAIVLAGHTGVSLFFVLSGFLLSRPFLAEARGGRVVSRGAYAMRRVLRVMPLYVVAVVVGSVAVAERPLDVLRGAPYLVFLNSLPRGAVRLDPHSDPWWSLATEAQFYLVLPFLPLVLRTQRGRLVGAVLLATYTAVSAALYLQWLRPATNAVLDALARSLVGRAPLFLAGIAAAAVYDRHAAGLRRWAVQNAAAARVTGDALLLAGLAGQVALLAWAANFDYVTLELSWPLWHVPEAVLWTTVMLALLLFPGSLKPLLANRAWAYLGLISYSLYLVHVPVIWYGRKLIIRTWKGILPLWFGPQVVWTWTGLAAALVLTAVAVGIASLTYVAIERPMLRLKSRIPT